MEQPMRYCWCMLHLYEKARKYQKRADKKRSKNSSQFDVKHGRNENPKALRHKTNEQVDDEETGEAEKLEWLTSEEVRDKNVTYSAEDLHRKIADDECQVIGSNRVPAVEVFTLYHGKLKRN